MSKMKPLTHIAIFFLGEENRYNPLHRGGSSAYSEDHALRLLRHYVREFLMKQTGEAPDLEQATLEQLNELLQAQRPDYYAKIETMLFPDDTISEMPYRPYRDY